MVANFDEARSLVLEVPREPTAPEETNQNVANVNAEISKAQRVLLVNRIGRGTVRTDIIGSFKQFVHRYEVRVNVPCIEEQVGYNIITDHNALFKLLVLCHNAVGHWILVDEDRAETPVTAV